MRHTHTHNHTCTQSHKHTHTHAHSTLNTPCISLWSFDSISGLRETDEIRALTSTHEQPPHKTHTYTHFKTKGLFEEMTSSSAAVSSGSRLAGARPIRAEITPANGYYTPYEGLLRWGWLQRHSSSNHLTHTYTHTSAGLIAQPITDRWMEQIMERSISVTSYRWVWCVCVCSRDKSKGCLDLSGDRGGHSSRLKGYLMWGLIGRQLSDWESEVWCQKGNVISNTYKHPWVF